MKHFILITNSYKDKGLALSNRILSYIVEKGGTAQCFVSGVESEAKEEFSLDEIPPNTECILVLGGDGTLIRAATKTAAMQIPLIGVNLGTLGYLCELEERTVFRAIDRLMTDSFTLEKRIMLTGHKAGSDKTSIAMNDIVLHRTGDLQILSIHVFVNGEFLSTYHADGIIVSTPTGSTGYNMSAGGPIVDPKGNMLVLTPINAHNLNSKSIVLDADDVIEIEIGSRRAKRDEKASVSFDGDSSICLNVGDKVIISRSVNYTTVCKLSNKSFLEILRKKMETYA